MLVLIKPRAYKLPLTEERHRELSQWQGATCELLACPDCGTQYALAYPARSSIKEVEVYRRTLLDAIRGCAHNDQVNWS
jgi:rRNA maturation protein Nop10